MSAVQVSKSTTFRGHKDAVYTLEPHAGNSQFYSGSGDGMVVRWDLDQPDKGHLVAKMDNSVYAIKCVPDRDILVVGHNFEGIHLIDLKKNEQLGSLALNKAAIFDMAFHEGILLVATGSGEVFVVALAQLKVLQVLNHSSKSARCISINNQRTEFAVGYSDNQIRVFDLKSYQQSYQLEGHQNSVFTVAYHPVDPSLLSGSRDAHIRIWDTRNQYQLTQSIAAHMYAINHLEFSPNGHHFVTCSMDKSIKVWDALRFKLLKVIDKARHASHGTSVNKLYWSPYNQQVVSCSDDRTISTWDINI